MQGRTNNHTRAIVLGGLFSALVLGATLIRVAPTDKAYFHLGEAVIYATAVVFGRWYGGIAGAIGSGLADLLSGYAFWAPVTVAVKFVEGYVVGTVGYQARPAKVLLAMVGGALILIAGYGIAAYGFFGIAGLPTELIGDSIQGLAGIVIGMLASRLLLRATKQYRPNED
ncbi:MAG: ECF transporter S component [Chloroflexota bacterium]